MLHNQSSGSGQNEAQKTAGIQPKRYNRKHTKNNHRRKGFSLIELLTTVGIIGVLASVAIPAYNKYRVNSNVGAVNAEVVGLKKAVEACLAAGGAFAETAGTGCASPTIAGVVSCTAITSKPGVTGKSIDDNDCHVGSDGKSKLCVSALKFTGGNWATECQEYTSSTGLWTTPTGDDTPKTGKANNVMGTDTGISWCKSGTSGGTCQ